MKAPITPPTATGIEAIVCADIARRQALGIAKYGTSVSDNPLPLRAWLQHAYEETLDKAVYLRRAIDEIDRKERPIQWGFRKLRGMFARQPRGWRGPVPSYDPKPIFIQAPNVVPVDRP